MSLSKFRQWVIDHDDSNLFLFLYIGSAVILSIAISLFWLVVVVFIHFVMECFKQYQYDQDISGVLIRSSWELLLDVGLIFFALLLAIYMDIILGAAGLGAGVRAGAQSASKIGVRFAGWQRAIRGIMLSVDDVAQVSKSVMKKGAKNDDEVEFEKFGGWVTKWGFGDKFTLSFTVLSLVFLFIAPIITDNSVIEVVQILSEEMKPIP